jgi:hypothetical protein
MQSHKHARFVLTRLAVFGAQLLDLLIEAHGRWL